MTRLISILIAACVLFGAAAEAQAGTPVRLRDQLVDSDDDRVIVKVHPAMVANKHPLATVSGAYNAIFVKSREAGELMFLGQGAGGARRA